MRGRPRLAFVLLIAALSGCGGPGSDVSTGSPSPENTALTGPTVTAVSPTETPSPETAPTLVPTALAGTATASATIALAETATAEATAGGNAAVRTELEGKLAFARSGDIWLYRPQTGEIRRILPDAMHARWSPDGKSIAFVRTDGLYIADAEGASERRVAMADNVLEPAWSPDGSKIAFGRGVAGDPSAVGDVWVYELAADTARRVAAGTDPAWAPDSQRIAYVTSLVGQEPRRNELRLMNWLGQNDWVVVSAIPSNTPRIGVPDAQVDREKLDHIMEAPFWDAEGRYLYAPSFVIYQALSDFSIWERADAQNGGSTFIGELPGVVDATPHPGRDAVLFSRTSARGDSWFIARALDGGQDQNWSWAEAAPAAISTAPAWAPDGQAVAYYRCELDAPDRCSLRLLTPEGEEPLIETVFDPETPAWPAAPSLDWGRDV